MRVAFGRWRKLASLTAGLCLLASGLWAAEPSPPLKAEFKPPKTLEGLPLAFSDDFSSGQTERWEPTDKTAWKITEQAGNSIYSLTKKKSDYNPKVRSPFNRSLVKDLVVEDFVLDVRLQSTEKDYAHRSLCLFFGYQDDEHLYYVHFGKKTDDHANQIFIVNDSPRKKISTKTTPGTDWDDEWHHARIIRAGGSIEVYFDDLKTPVMTANDTTFPKGRVGIGSFDDKGQFDHVAVYGNVVEDNQSKLGQVQGTVKFKGQPLAGAAVIFLPQTGLSSVGETDQEGRYTLGSYKLADGALVGKHTVTISTYREDAEGKTSRKEQVPAKYNVKSTLTVDVKAGMNELNFDLKE